MQTTYQYNAFETFNTFFREMLGDMGNLDDLMDEVEYYDLLYLFFLIATLVLYITMLNLLIAIISDTFARVKGAEKLTRIWERWNIMTEIDIMMPNKTDVNEINEYKQKYLVFLYNDRHLENDKSELETIDEKLNFLEQKLSQNTEDVSAHEQKNEMNFMKIQESFSALEVKNEMNFKKLQQSLLSEMNSLKQILKPK